MHSRPLLLSIALICATIAAGLALRLVPVGLPFGLVKYGGSVLWALMVYWMISTLFPRGPIARGAFVAAAVATAVELFKLVHTPPLDAFRLTLPGKLLLGRVFAFSDLAAYAAAILIGAWIDRAIRQRI